MLDRQLTRLIDEATRRVRGDNPVPWGIVGVAAYVLRRALREDAKPSVQRVTVREGGEVTISLRPRDD